MPKDIRGQTFPKGRGLNVHIVIYVPSTKNVNQKISENQFKGRIRQTAKFLSSAFGGTTRVRGIGTWLNKKTLVQERIAKVETFTNVRDYKKVQGKIKKWLRKRKKQWRQKALSYEFEEALFFV